MAKYRLKSIAQLARQLVFSPQNARVIQVAAAEELLHSVDPATAYPLNFVVFRITGYHPRKVTEDLLTGLALQHDLGLLIEQVSDSLELKTSQVIEPVLSIDDVIELFNVTGKTIQRWRRRGLPARHFEFADGKCHVGFLLSSVERFFNLHREQVTRGANFSQLTAGECQTILRQARRLADHCCPQEIARRIGRKLNRSPLAILHTIRKHDDENPADAIFVHAAKPLSEEDRQRVIGAEQRGMGIATIARQMGLRRSEVARTLVEERIGRLNHKRIRFVDDPLFHHDDAAQAVENTLGQGELPATGEATRIPRGLPPLLADLCSTPLLTASRERALFLKFNFHKYQFVMARRRLDPQFVRNRDLLTLEAYLHQATEAKNEIVRANLRLVVSIARKHLRPGLSLAELISDGSMTLMRAVEGFNINRGTRFSTYATLSLMKGFARSVPAIMSFNRGRAQRAATTQLDRVGELADARQNNEMNRLLDTDEIDSLLEHLDSNERTVLAAHYGLGGVLPAVVRPKRSGRRLAGHINLDRLSASLGISRQRVRQIEQSAMAKLRAASEV